MDLTQLILNKRINCIPRNLKLLNTSTLKTYLEERFYSSSLHLEMENIIQNVLKTSSPQNALDNVNTLSDEGSAGIVLSGGINIENNLFTIKVSKPDLDTGEIKRREIIHEYLVGLTLNTLRSKTPCFMYTYGIFNCNIPVEEKVHREIDYSNIEEEEKYITSKEYILNYPKKNIRLCKGTVPTPHLVTEYIKGISFTTFLKDIPDFDSLGKIVLMIFISLAIAYEEVGFTHYDLHANNIIIRELPEEKTFEFVHQNKSYVVKTKYLPVIIDYGLSTVKNVFNIQQTTLLFTHFDADEPKYPFLNDQNKDSCPAVDYHKLLVFMLILCINIYTFDKNMKSFFFSLILDMCQIFHPEDTFRILKSYKNLDSNFQSYFGYPSRKPLKCHAIVPPSLVKYANGNKEDVVKPMNERDLINELYS